MTWSLIVPVLLASLHAPPAAGESAALAVPVAAGDIEVTVCNRSSRPVAVAVNYQRMETGRWVYEGWKQVPAGSCDLMFRTGNTIFYMRAEASDGSDISWAGEAVHQCVVYPGPYEFTDDGQQSSCVEGQSVLFERLEAEDDASSFRWTLTD